MSGLFYAAKRVGHLKKYLQTELQLYDFHVSTTSNRVIPKTIFWRECNSPTFNLSFEGRGWSFQIEARKNGQHQFHQCEQKYKKTIDPFEKGEYRYYLNWEISTNALHPKKYNITVPEN